MNTNTVLKLLAVAILLGLGAFLFLQSTGGGAVGPERPQAPGPAPVDQAEDLTGVAQERAAGATAERVEAAATFAHPKLAPWSGELAGIVGRVVENDGTPVVGVRVALLEFDGELLFSGGVLDLGEQPASLELEESITDSEGRFLLGGARAPAFHALGVDLGGPRSTLRIIDTALVHRERTDVGDIVLAPFGVLTGRVVDDGGAPVSGARIRVGPFPDEVLLGAPYELRSDSLVGISMLVTQNNGQGVVELPGWIRQLADDLPVPTTHSDSEGYFRLEGVALARIVGGVDKPGFAGTPLGPIDMNAAGEQDIGNVTLSRGRTIEGVVEDAEGEPLVGLEVYAGAEVPAGFAAILQPCGKTDEDGMFRLRGVRSEGQVMAITRRSSSEPWVGEVTPRFDDILLSLETAIHLTVLVKNEAGEPLSGARILLDPVPESGGMMGMDQVLNILPRDIDPVSAFREPEPGRYVNPSVTPGKYELTAHVKGLALGKVEAEIWDEESEVVVTCPTGDHLQITVVDSLSQEPIAKASAQVMDASEFRFSRLASGMTNGTGQVRLGPVSWGQQPDGARQQQTFLVVRHPRYADSNIELDSVSGDLVVPMEGGGMLSGKVHWDGEVPTRFYMVQLEYRGSDGFMEIFTLPRFMLTDVNGAFRVGHLQAGEYRVELYERFLDKDPLGLVGGDFEPTRLYQENVQIAVGETTELVIDLTATGRGPVARLTGRVRVDGREVEGAEVHIRANGSVTAETDQWGRFETEEFSMFGTAWVTIEGQVEFGGRTRHMQIFQENLELETNEVRDLDIDLMLVAFPAEVVDGLTGAPLAGAQVSARPTGDNAKAARGFHEGFETDDAGEVSVWVPGTGPYAVTAQASGYAQSTGSLEVPESGAPADSIRLELFRSVPCAGRILLSSAAPQGQSFSYLAVRSVDDVHNASTMLQGPDYEFDLDGLTAGDYRAWVYVEGRLGQEVSFSLGPDGDRNLLLEFLPETE